MSSVIPFPARHGGLAGGVAENIRVACARRGWKQVDLARALGVSKATVNAKWMGDRPWQLADIEDVAEALHVPVQGLLAYTARDSNPEPAD